MPKIAIFKNQILRTEPRPEVRIIEQTQSPSVEMRKWLLEGHKENKETNIVF